MGSKILPRIFVFLLCFSVCFQARCEDKKLLAYFLKYLPLSSKEISQLKNGEPVTGFIETSIKNEIFTFGAARMDFPADYFLDQYRNIESFKLQFSECNVGILDPPISEKKFSKLSLTPEELQALRACRPGKCKLNLSEEMIWRINYEIDWRLENSKEKAPKVFRQMLAEYVKDYEEHGVTSLIRYHHRKDPFSLQSTFLSMVGSSRYLTELVPKLVEHLEEFPNKNNSGAEDFLYWSKEEFGLKPVIAVTHVTIYREPEVQPDAVWIVSRQIFSSRYTEGWFSVSILVSEDNESANSGFYLLFFNKTRSTNFQGPLGGLKRSLVERRACPRVEAAMRQIKQKIGESYRTEALVVRRK